jgi:hypothetical protein
VADTRATVFLKSSGIAYTEHEYDYVEHGGFDQESRAAGGKETHRAVQARPAPRLHQRRAARFLIRIKTEDLEKTLKPQLVDAALED